MEKRNAALPISPREKTACFLLTVLMFLLPLKFGAAAVVPESTGYFPEEWSGYLFSTWPAAALGIFAGVILLLTLGTAAGKKEEWFFGAGFLLAALPGACFGTGEKEVTQELFSYLAAIGALSLASAHLARRIPRAPEWFCAALLAGALVTACNGFHQYMFGFEELRQFAAAQQAKGIVLPESLLLKLNDTRISSYFISSNALAGFLLMSLPAALFFGKTWSRYFTPVSLSLPLFWLVFAGIPAAALILAGARSVLPVTAAALLTALFFSPKLSRTQKLCGAGILILLLAASAAFLLWRGRAFTSMGERADYLHTCAVMCREHPLSGGGWGSFHFRHMEIKLSATDEAARDPHNMVASYAAQSGIPAGIAVLALLLFPLWKLWGSRFSGVRGVIFWISLLFVLHTLMDSDMLIPALFGSFSVLVSAAAAQTGDPALGKERQRIVPALATVFIALSALLSGIYWSFGEYQFARFRGGVFPQNEEEMRHTSLPEIRMRYELLRRLRPFCAIVPETMGVLHEKNAEWEQAEACFAEAQQLEPRRPSVYRHLARMAYRKGDLTRAAAYREEARRRFPKAPEKLERMMQP